MKYHTRSALNFLLSAVPVLAGGSGLTAKAVLLSSAAADTDGSKPLIIQAPDQFCGFRDGVQDTPYGCNNSSDICALYFASSSTESPPLRSIGRKSELDSSSWAPSLSITEPTTHPRLRARFTSSPGLPRAVTAAPPSPAGSVVCCAKDNGQCLVQPTTCVDRFNYPASILCTGACINDPMTLKCTQDAHMFCNQVKFESPLEYLRDRSHDGWLYGSSVNNRAIVAGLIRGWFCDKTPVAGNLVVMNTRPLLSTGNGVYSPAVSTSIKDALSTAASITTPEAKASTSAIDDLADIPPPASSEAVSIIAEQPLNGAVDKQTEDCETITAELDGYFDSVEQASCLESCVDIVPRTVMIRQRQLGRAWAATKTASYTSGLKNKEFDDEESAQSSRSASSTSLFLTSAVRISRPITTIVPQGQPNVTIVEAVIVISTAFNVQIARRYLSEANRTLTVVTPTPEMSVHSTTSTRGHKTHGGAHPSTEGNNGANPSAAKIAGAIVGGILGTLLLGGTAYIIIVKCFLRRDNISRDMAFNDPFAIATFSSRTAQAGSAESHQSVGSASPPSSRPEEQQTIPGETRAGRGPHRAGQIPKYIRVCLHGKGGCAQSSPEEGPAIVSSPDEWFSCSDEESDQEQRRSYGTLPIVAESPYETDGSDSGSAATEGRAATAPSTENGYDATSESDTIRASKKRKPPRRVPPEPPSYRRNLSLAHKHADSNRARRSESL